MKKNLNAKAQRSKDRKEEEEGGGESYRMFEVPALRVDLNAEAQRREDAEEELNTKKRVYKMVINIIISFLLQSSSPLCVFASLRLCV